MTAALRVLAAALLLAAGTGFLAPATGVIPAAVVRAADTDLTLVTDATYTVKPDAQRVNVVMGIHARNHTSETKTKKLYFDHAFLAVPRGTTGYKISGAKGAKVRVARRTKDATLLRIDFGQRLFSGQARDYRLSFDILGSGKGANPQTRVGTGLITLPVWAYASNGARGSSVNVRFPPGWTVDVEAGSFARRSKSADGGVVLSSGSLASPLSFFSYVSAQQPPQYVEHPVAVTAGDQQVALVLEAWKDDAAWADRTGKLFRRALPVLRDEIAIDWPHADAIRVRESVNRTSDGHAGVFDPGANTIEVAYWADGLVTLHEAAHGWFNGSLLADRWADEGFASLYAGRAATALKVKGKAPAMTEAATKAAIALNAWGQAGGDAPVDRATETYGYVASLELATAIADRAGDAALQRVWADAAGRVGAYQPPPGDGAGASAPTGPETVDGPPDWRGLLDLLEAETGRDFSDLWHATVVRPDEAAVLDARGEARVAYERTLALTKGWALPRQVRDALRSWQFASADQLMADARTVIAQRDAVEELAARNGVTLPDTMRTLFEAGSLTEASALAEAERNEILAVAQAEGSRSTDDDILSRIGMLGEEPEADLAAAKVALATGDHDATLAAADDAYRAWSGAWQEGRRRAMFVLAAIATLLVLLTAAGGALRRARRSRSDAGGRSASA